MSSILAAFALGINWPTLVFALVLCALLALVTDRWGPKAATGILCVALILLLLVGCGAVPAALLR